MSKLQEQKISHSANHDAANQETHLLRKELKKLRLEVQLRKNLSNEFEKQKQLALDAQEVAKEKANELDKLLKRQKLETQLRKNLADEMQKQKDLAIQAQALAHEKKNEIETLSQQLSKYLSPQIYNSIFTGEKQASVVSQRKKLTVFFSDIVGFTAISDELEAEEISSMLNYYLTEMSQLALNYGGTIDKYIGDAILIFFGDPETKGTKQDALQCVHMAIAMQHRMKELENKWAENFGLREPLQIRIGIATGYCTVGNFGSENRLDYTVIGSQVNLASRLETLARPANILLSFDTYSQVSGDINCRELEKVMVKGIREPVRTFEVSKSPEAETGLRELQTKNLRLTADTNLLEIQELECLENFVTDLRSKIRDSN